MRKQWAFAGIALASWCGLASEARGAASCESLSPLDLAGAKVTSTEVVAAGAFTPPANLAPWLSGDPALYKRTPAFCRVKATARPSADSDIKIEVWMPVTGWNGRLRALGNGGFAGELDYRGLAATIGRGYAAAATDTGHAAGGTDARWALGHPEKVVDFGYRAVHEMTRTAKAAIAAFYGRPPQRSYFGGCSNGGRQALMEAQRFPEDYDGILAGAPANSWTRLLTSAIYDAQVTTKDDDSYIPPAKLPAIADAVNAACDARDGVPDGILQDPRQCRFDPASLLCKDADATSCLTSAQVTALRKLYAGPRRADGSRLFPGFVPGAEGGRGGWGTWITGQAPGQGLIFVFGNAFFTNMVYEKAGWNHRTVSLDVALKDAEDKTGRVLNATDPDLKQFEGHGGRLILYHGWSDPGITPLSTIDYYDRVVAAMGPKDVGLFLRLYMAPGVQHCEGGPGADAFGQGESMRSPDARHSLQLALETWVEGGTAPAAIVATKYADGPPATNEAPPAVQMTRLLCPYPQIALYKGAGDHKDASSFTCGAR